MKIAELQELKPPAVPGLYLKLPQLEYMTELLEVALGSVGQRWYTLRQAHAKKYGAGEGGVSLATIRNSIAMQPRGGIPDAWHSGNKTWAAETIDEWCMVDDLHLEEYLARHNPLVSVPERIRENNRRRLMEYPPEQQAEEAEE